MLIDDAGIWEDAVAEPHELATAVRPLLGPHPVPQSDPRTRGLMMEIAPAADRDSQAASVPTPLAGFFARFAGSPQAAHILAVNETPPTDTDRFLMLPHLDRTGPERRLPTRTVVAFLDFPEDGEGGELVIFPRHGRACARIRSRESAREAAAVAGGVLVSPVPGRVCTMAGDQPHAVLGYTAGPGRWRLAIVLATLGPDPTNPSDPAP